MFTYKISQSVLTITLTRRFLDSTDNGGSSAASPRDWLPSHDQGISLVLKLMLVHFDHCPAFDMVSWKMPSAPFATNVLRPFIVNQATAGGGGRGMRLANEPEEFVKLLQVFVFQESGGSL